MFINNKIIAIDILNPPDKSFQIERKEKEIEYQISRNRGAAKEEHATWFCSPLPCPMKR